MSIEKNIYEIKRELSGRYQIDEEHHNLCGRKLAVTCVEDAEELFSKMVVADPDSIEVQDERLPYWATLWDSALIMAETLLNQNLISPGEHVLELGCGLGLTSSIACLKRAHVTATDYQADALQFTRLNCLQIAGIDPTVQIIDWREPPRDQQYATLLGTDLVYEPRFYTPLIETFDALLAPGGRILFSEPNRVLGQAFFDRLAPAGWKFIPLAKEEKATIYEIRRIDD